MEVMEALSRSLQPYKEILGSVATVVTIAQFFSGAVLCRDIHRKKSTKGFSSTPFIGSVVVGILMIKYSLVLQDAAMLRVNVAAVFLNIIYSFIYHAYSKDRTTEVYKPLSYGIAVTAIFLGYSAVESEENLEYRYGLLVTILMLMLLGAPLADLKQIIEKKDASSIPLPLTFMGAIVTFLWFIYGIILLNSFMLVQNIIGFTLCIVQLILVVMYPGEPEDRPKDD